MGRWRYTIIAALVLISACAAPQRATDTRLGSLTRLAPSGYPAFIDDGEPASLATSVGRTLTYISKLPPDREFLFGNDSYTAAEMAGSLTEFQSFLLTNPGREKLRQYVSERFTVYTAPGPREDGSIMFTGYYTTEVMASPVMDDVYRSPLYAPPSDLVTADLGLFRDKLKGDKISGMVADGALVPYYTRKDIDSGGALNGRGLELAYCKDPADAFFLHVQGSGVLVYPDGTRVHANYAGANGRPYRSIGRFLIEQGKADKDTMSMDWLKGYLSSHPDEAESILCYNESYVFFRLEESGPFGCLGQPVTPERSVATDKALFPPGALIYVETEIPKSGNDSAGPADRMAGQVTWKPYSRFMLDQDTGGAIKAAGRVDIYFGSGREAEQRAGYMRRAGRLYYLAGRRIPEQHRIR